MAKNGHTARQRGRAIAVAATLVVTGSTVACSQEPNKPDYGSIALLVDEALTEVRFGKPINEIIDENFRDSATALIDKVRLGVKEDSYKDYETDQMINDFKGPILFQISYFEGELRFKDLSPDGIEPQTLQWLLLRIKQRESFFLAAGKSGKLKSIDFMLNVTDVLDYEFTDIVTEMTGAASNEGALQLVFPRGVISLDASVFDQMLIHEVSHFLAAGLSDEFLKEKSNERAVIRLQESCAGIRERSIEELQKYSRAIAGELRMASEFATSEKYRHSLSVLADYYENGRFVELYPEHDPNFVEIQEPQFGGESAKCATNSLSRQSGMVFKMLGYERTEEEFDELYMSDAYDHLGMAEEIIYEMLEKDSIFKYLAEKTYNPENNFGHGYDNLNEQLATAIALLTSPQDTGYFLSFRSREDTELVLEFIEAAKALVVEGYPELKPTLDACSSDLSKFFELSYDRVSKECNVILSH